MDNQTFLKTTKLNNEILSLKEEVRTLRSVIIGLLGKDKEGNYRPEFIKKVLKTSKEKPIGVFKDKKTFLKEIL